MATATKTFPANRGTTRVKFPRETYARDGGGEQHFMCCVLEDGVYYSYVRFAMNWDNVVQIKSAHLVVTSKDVKSHAGSLKDGSGIRVTRLTSSFPDANNSKGENVFVKGTYPAEPKGTEYNNGVINEKEGEVTRINVTDLVNYEAPKTVKKSTGGAGAGRTHYGWALERRERDAQRNPRIILASDKHPVTEARPYIELVYVPKPAPGTAEITGPAPVITDILGESIEAAYTPGRDEDRLAHYEISIRLKDGAEVWNSGKQAADPTDILTGTFSVPLTQVAATGSKYTLKTATNYEFRVRAWNNRGEDSPWTGYSALLITTNPPLLTGVVPTSGSATYATLDGVMFGATYSDPEKNPLTGLRFLFQTAGGEDLWESGTLAPTAGEKTSGSIRRLYGGPGLEAGDYVWQVWATDSLGAESAPVGGSFTLTQGTFPDRGEVGVLTGYNRQRRRTRITIREADKANKRRPGKVVAIIENASNVGASEFHNTGGEFFFTLGQNDPQAPAVEPRQTHYVLEQYRGEGWVQISAGLMVDVDASGSDIVFYGYDYLGILGLMVDERFNPLDDPDKAVVLWKDSESGKKKGGSKYVNKTISEVVRDQLERAIYEDSDSPLAFFSVGSIARMDERISIFCTFKERGPFIAGLLDSHRAGTGKRTRLRVRVTAAGGYQFVVDDDPGRDRPQLRLEYGGLAQDFRIVPFGDWATRVNAVGRTVSGADLLYYVAQPPPPTGETDQSWFEHRYGRYPKPTIFDNVSDKNDLIRRGKQAVRTAAKLGKRVSIGLRPDVLDVKDGWDITDSIPIDIQRGAIDTNRMGSGYWTIWGWTWEAKPNGYRNLVLSLLPRDDTEAPDLDLLPSVPIFVGPEWEIGTGLPPATVPDGSNRPLWWVDAITGHIWRWDPTLGEYVDLTATQPTKPFLPGVGTITPDYFPDYVRPIVVVTELPNLPDPSFPENSVVIKDGVLYINHGDVWETVQGSPGPAGPPGPEGPPGQADTTPPAVPTGLYLRTQSDHQPDGSIISDIYAIWNRVTDPDLSRYGAELNRAVSLRPRAWASEAVPGTLTDGTYVVLVTATGFSGGESMGLEQRVTIDSGTGGGIRISSLLSSIAGITSLVPPFRIYMGQVGVATRAAGVGAFNSAFNEDFAQQAGLNSAGDIPLHLIGSTTANEFTIIAPNSGGQRYTGQTTAFDDRLGSVVLTDTEAASFLNVEASSVFSVRVAAIDESYNWSEWSDRAIIMSAADAVPPGVPASLDAVGGNKRIGVKWALEAPPDLDRYEIRFRKRGTDEYEYAVTYSTFIMLSVSENRVSPSDPSPVMYEGNVRAIDRSGNVDASRVPGEVSGVAASYLDLAAGWSGEWEAESSLTKPEDMAVESLFAEYGYLINLTADQIRGGNLEIRADTDSPGSITIYNELGQLAGRWDPSGWFLIDTAEPTHAIRGKDGKISFTNHGQTDGAGNATLPWLWPEAVWTTAISADGINADFITTGAQVGGHNRLLNSGFELTPVAKQTFDDWDTAQEWDATIGTTVNKVIGATSFIQSDFSVP